MGGFLANLGSGLAGAGAAAAPYREQVLNRWERHKEAVTNQLSQLIATESDPAKRSTYIQHLFDVNNLKVGQDPSKVLKDLNETFMPHPVVTQGLGDQQGKPQPVQPGPATGGATPGTLGTAAGPQTVAPQNPMAGLIAGPQPAPNAAQAPSSPVAPASQAGELTPMPGTIGLGMGPGNTVAPLATPPMAPTATPAAPAAAAIPAVGGTGLPTPQDPQAIMSKYMTHPMWSAPVNRPALTQAMNDELSHNEALRQQLEQHQYDLHNRQSAYQEMKQNGAFDGMPAMYKAAWLAWSHTPGMQAPAIAPGMTLPHVISTGSMGSQAPEGTVEYGTNKPVNPKGRYRQEYIPMTGEVAWVPIQDQFMNSPTENGGVGRFNKQTGEAAGTLSGAVPGSQLTPIKEPTVGGGVELTTPVGMRQGLPPVTIPGAVAPSMLGTAHSSVPLPGGGMASTSRKISPVAGGGAAAPRSGGGGGYSSDPAAVSYAVQQLTKPNMSTGEFNTTFKAVVGADKALARDVRTAMAKQGTNLSMFDSQIADQAKLANQVESHLGKVNTLIDQLDKAGQLGPAMGRWNEFLAGKYGSGNPQYAQLRLNMGLLETALGRVHGGARGGGSPQMLEHFKSLMNSDHMDAATLKSTLGEVKAWLDTYANPATTTRSQQVLPVGVPGVGDHFGGGKVLSVERVP